MAPSSPSTRPKSENERVLAAVDRLAATIRSQRRAVVGQFDSLKGELADLIDPPVSGEAVGLRGVLSAAKRAEGSTFETSQDKGALQSALLESKLAKTAALLRTAEAQLDARDETHAVEVTQ